MEIFEKLNREDQRNIKIWKKNKKDKDSDKTFYKANKKIRKRLNNLLKDKKHLTSREHFICAIILHHGFTLSSSKRAIRHIKIAQEKGYKKQKWLIASIKDRILQIQGKPQKYGTQAIRLKNGKYKQYKTDESIDDKKRKSLGLPSFKELKKYLEK
jgi:hypothetical protein